MTTDLLFQRQSLVRVWWWATSWSAASKNSDPNAVTIGDNPMTTFTQIEQVDRMKPSGDPPVMNLNSRRGQRYAVFTKKPVTVEAFQLTPGSAADRSSWPIWAQEAWEATRASKRSKPPRRPTPSITRTLLLLLIIWPAGHAHRPDRRLDRAGIAWRDLRRGRRALALPVR